MSVDRWVQRFAPAFRRLDGLLGEAGLMLHRRDGRLILTPRSCELLTTKAMEAAVASTSTRPDIAPGDAVLVYEALRGTRSAKSHRSSVNGVLRTGRLRKQGLITEPEKETAPMVVGKDIRFSLMLDDDVDTAR